MSNERISHFLLFFLILLPYNLALALAVYGADCGARRTFGAWVSIKVASRWADRQRQPSSIYNRKDDSLDNHFSARQFHQPAECMSSGECRVPTRRNFIFFLPKKRAETVNAMIYCFGRTREAINYSYFALERSF